MNLTDRGKKLKRWFYSKQECSVHTGKGCIQRYRL